MPRLPQVSGRELLRLLNSLGYEVVRQRGSHIRLRKVSALGEHNVTVPDHSILAKGTLNDTFMPLPKPATPRSLEIIR